MITAKEKLLNFLDGFVMYLFTLAGVFFSKYFPMLREGIEFEISFSSGRFITTCMMAFMLLTAAENLGGSNKAGKRKRFLWRAISALTYGAFWYNVIGG